MINSSKKKRSCRNGSKSHNKKFQSRNRTGGYNNKKKYSKLKDTSKIKDNSKLYQLDDEEEEILKEFRLMENRIKDIKNVNKIQEIKNVGVDGIIEKNTIKSNPEKKPRRSFTGCAIKTKTTLYESLDENAKQNEYLEIKKIYRNCPK